jgi:hypothetical protein
VKSGPFPEAFDKALKRPGVLGRRLNDPKELLRYASASGRSFPTYIDRILCPQTEAVQILRNARLPSVSSRRTSSS